MERKPRAIRMSDAEWASFMLLLGPEWLRGQIDKAIKRNNRKPVDQG